MDIIQERRLPVVASITTGFRVRGLDNELRSVSIPIDIFLKERYRGLAYVTTNPDISQIGDWFSCAEDGIFTYFGNQSANRFDRFYFNGTTWDKIPLSQAYGGPQQFIEFVDTDPSTVPAPSENEYKMGIFGGKVWVKDSDNVVSWLGNDVQSEEIELATDGDTDIPLSRELGAQSIIFYNGSVLPSANWQDLGGTLRLNFMTYAGDLVHILY